MENGFILLNRCLLDHQIFASEKLLKIWIWCLCKANYKDKFVPLKVGKGTITIEIKRGQFIFGRNKAEEELFIDGSTIYKCIQKLASFDSIFIESNNQYSIITICNYDSYQDLNSNKVTSNEQVSNNQVTSNEQVSNNQVTQLIHNNTDNTIKRKIKNIKKVSFQDFPSNILELTKKLSEYFDKSILEKLSISDKLNWVKTVNELIIKNKISEIELESVVKTARNDEFWKSNFLSLRKLTTKDKNGVMYFDRFKNLNTNIPSKKQSVFIDIDPTKDGSYQ